jgi:hypothetical protein
LKFSSFQIEFTFFDNFYLKHKKQQNENNSQEDVLPLLQRDFLNFVETAIVEPLEFRRLEQVNVHN